MACDLCDAKGTALTDLRDQYSTSDVRSVCPSCESIINKRLRKVQSFAFGLIGPLMRRYIIQKKNGCWCEAAPKKLTEGSESLPKATGAISPMKKAEPDNE